MSSSFFSLIGVYHKHGLNVELVFFLFHFWNILRNLRKKKALEYFSWNNRSFFEKRAFWVYHFVLFLITKTIIFLKKTHSKSQSVSKPIARYSIVWKRHFDISNLPYCYDISNPFFLFHFWHGIITERESRKFFRKTFTKKKVF